MPGQVLGSGTDRHIRIVDFEAHFRPLGHRVKVDTTLDEGLGQVLSLGLQGVGSDGKGALVLVSLDELKALARGEQVQQELNQVSIVVVGSAEIVLELVKVVLPAL